MMSNKETPNPDSVAAEDLAPPTDLNEVEALQNKITQLEADNAELNDKITRLMAELHNLGSRLRKDSKIKQEYAIKNFAEEILDVGDILKTGLDNCENKDNEYYKGMEMTLDKFFIILKQHGITPIESLHKPFDHDVHEALTSQETDELEPGLVMHVVQEGYKLKERVLRPAKVIVSKKVSEET